MNTTWRRLGIVVVLFVAALATLWGVPLTGYAASAETDLFSDNFDGYLLGSFPSDFVPDTWEIVWDGRGENYVVYGPSISFPQSLQLWGRPNWSAIAQRRFTTDAPVIGYEYWIQIDAVGTGGPDRVEWPGFFSREAATWGRGYATARFNHDTRQIEAEDGTVLGSWSPRTWYRVKVILDRRTNLYSVWIDGRLAGQNLQTRFADTQNINAMALMSGHPGVKIWYDDVRVFIVAADPDPGIALVFADPNLEAAIREAIGKPTGPLLRSDVQGLESLTAGSRGIVSLEGLQHCVNLREIYLLNNQIADLSPLAGLVALETLGLAGNQIEDVTPLRGLTSLSALVLAQNPIEDITPLTRLTKLTELALGGGRLDIAPLAHLTNLEVLILIDSQITDLSPLAGLTDLRVLHLIDNEIADVRALEGLTSLINLDLRWNYLDLTLGSPAMQVITALQNRGVDVSYTPQREPPPTNQPPVASLTFSPTDPSPGQIVRFDGRSSYDPDGHIVSYAWQFGDGNTGTGATPSHTYATAGTYTVRLTVTDNQGATGSADRAIAVEDETAEAPVGMALIPAGRFRMGDTFSEGDSDERPVHNVYVSAFYMDIYHVTKALWDEVATWASRNGYDIGPSDASGKASSHPVYSVSWYQAVKWCNARSEMEGRPPAYYTSSAKTTVYRTGDVDVQNDWVRWDTGYRLPTEAEWEKAARGGCEGRRFPWCDPDTITHSQANYQSRSGYYGTVYDTSSTRGYHPTYETGSMPYTSPVGSFAPNGYGLYDMAGNVMDWCWDWYSSDYYASSPGIDPRGPTLGTARATRGGSWFIFARYCRVARRGFDRPVYGSDGLGFRTVLPPDPEPDIEVSDRGDLYAFGFNWAGQLGLGDTDARTAPQRVEGLPSPAIASAAGDTHSLALLENGDVYAFGQNTAGQLGLGDDERGFSYRAEPHKVDGLPEPAAAVAAGDVHSLVLLREGSVYAFGGGGLVGQIDRFGRRTPTLVRHLPPDAISIAAGSVHSLVLLENGDVYAFGHNWHGQLGLGHDTDQGMPKKVEGLPHPAMAVAAGTHHSLVLLVTGEVYAFGANGYGQLGLGHSDPDDQVRGARGWYSPQKVEGLPGRAVAVAAGAIHSLVLLENGDVYAFGRNTWGQLGLGDTEDRHQPHRVEGLPGSAVAVAAGGDLSLVLLSGGEVYEFGVGGHHSPVAVLHTPVRLAGLPGPAVDLSVGRDHALVIVGR